jgi:hypothetical protein
MNAARFHRLIAEAVAAREPLDTEEFALLAEVSGEETFWRSQVDLDRAICAWKQREKPTVHRRRFAQRILLSVAGVAAGLGAIWMSRPIDPIAPRVQIETSIVAAPTDAIMPPVPAIAQPWSPDPVVAPKPSQDRRLADAAETAERLAYAFQPVGEQVSSVVRLLIDAVPGSDVLAL